jgi:integrase
MTHVPSNPWRSERRANQSSLPLADVKLVHLTPGSIETFLQKRGREVGPQTVNHLRRFILVAFTRAKQAGKWAGANPAKEVQRRKVPKRLPDFLRAEKVPLVLAALSDKHRPLFATAVYTGMRRGELLGLRKTDVDFTTGLITVSRSHARDTTKGNRAAAIPIADELRPYLKQAVERSLSEFVFPGDDGERMSAYNPLEEVLRRALGRAGIVLHYEHVCRKKGCGPCRAGEGRCGASLPEARAPDVAEGQGAADPVP